MRRSDGIRPAAWATVAVLVVSVTSLVICYRAGVAGRAPAGPFRPLSEGGPHPIVVDTGAAMLEAWERSGARGRVLVHLGRGDHFRPIENAVPNDLRNFPVRIFDLSDAYRSLADGTSLLWVAVRLGVAREVVEVVPPGIFDATAAALLADDPAARRQQHRVVTHDFGSRRTVTDRLPSSSEPVVLGVDASYLEYVTAEQTLAALTGSDLESDLVVLSLAVDDPSISADARRRLRELAAALGGSGR